MIVGMTRKITVSLPDHLVDTARRAVARGLAPSFSAYVAKALEEKARLDDLGLLLDEMLEASGGPLTDEEIRWADAILLGHVDT